jgi:hypothetical protein
MPNDDLERARAESAELLGLNPDKLTPAQTLKCDLVSALRLVIDDELARATRGSGADLSKLIVAVDHLTTFMRDASPAEIDPDPYEDVDPHRHLEELVTRYFAAKEGERAEKAAERREQGLSEPFADLDAAQARIDELEAHLAEFEPGNDRLRGDSPKALPSPSAKVITPTESDIVPPCEIGEFYVGHRPGPDDHRATRRPPVIDGEVIPSKPAPPKRQPMTTEEAARAVGLRQATYQEPWRGHTHLFE